MKNLICSEDSSIREVMKVIDKQASGVTYIVDADGRLTGIATDGDIRRGLIGGSSVEDPVADVMKRDFVYAKEGASIDEMAGITTEKIKFVPIVDENFRPVDIFQKKAAFYVPIASPALDGKELDYLMECVTTNWISSQGKFVKKFEEGLARYCGSRYGISVMNGTCALHLAMLALDIGPGDEVIVPDLTFASTINAVIYTGATPVMVDVEEQSWCMDPERMKEAITDKTKAVIPVHLYGQSADMESIMNIAREKNLFVVEDCAEALGAEFDGKKVGTFGHISCFSFFGNKIITTGEGGMCLTDDDSLAAKMRLLRDHGMSPDKRYWHETVGYNYRMTNMQAAIGVAQLERMEKILERREAIERVYAESLEDLKGLIPQRRDLEKRKKVCWIVSYILEDIVKGNEAFLASLKEKGVDSRPFFYPLSLMEPYKGYARYKTPVANDISRSGISFPTIMSIPPEGYAEIIAKIRESFDVLF